MNISQDNNETSAVLYDLPLDVIYIVFIKASSKAGESLADITKQLIKQVPDKLLSSSQLSIIVGSVLGAILIAIFIFLLLYRRYKIRKSKRIRKYLWEIPNTPSEYYIPEIINDEWQLKSNQIIVDGDEILGEGAFGVVHKGYIRMVDETEIEVAIKMLKGNSSVEEIKQFEHEIEIMKSVGSHPHLVSLIGCCTKMGHLGPFLVVEYCAKGSLLSYLRAVWEQLAGQPSESRYINTPCFAENNHTENNFSNKLYLLGDDIILDPQDLLSFARQIALGMEYLSGLRVVHRDLALRNVLMCENKIVKVADFGLSRDVYQDNVYLKTGTGKLPIKWMALESLSHQQYTTQSDVWSYGVVLWEIVTLGGNPYATISPRDMLSILRSGYRMECPKNCSLELYAIMRQCWRDSAKERPTFHDLKLMIEELLESDNRYVSLDI
ncbi:hypothetical protein RI129_003743 [Pyrocoelia pectoralis]|uniref:receptor protein-tyrosine kinase n=1 Tax=Pyrocoelia pectoralis TaxID=417401 RepID=A0AAN7VQ32_9COLE